MRRLPLLALCVLVAACGARTGATITSIDSGPAADTGRVDGGLPDAGPPDAGSRDAGSPDAGSPDAGPPPVCPPSAPTDGAACHGDLDCTYDLCPGPGVIDVACSGGTWRITTTPCGLHGCDCPPEMVCVEVASGTSGLFCQPNPCGIGLFDCSCAESLCPAGAMCSTSGIDVQCIIDCGGCP